MLLGDACLFFANTKDARFQVHQNNKDFVQHLYEVFSPLGIVGTEPRPRGVDQLRDILLTKYDIESTRVLSGSKSRDQYRISIPKREVIKVQNTVRDFIPSMMKHRVGL